LFAGSWHYLIKERANGAKLGEIVEAVVNWRIFPTNYWWRIPSLGWEHSSRPARRSGERFREE